MLQNINFKTIILLYLCIYVEQAASIGQPSRKFRIRILSKKKKIKLKKIEEKVDKYLEWGREQGVNTDYIYATLDEYHGGYAMLAKKIIPKNQEIIKIPKNLVINRGSINNLITELKKDETQLNTIRSFQNALYRIDELSNGTNNDPHILAFFILYQRAFPERLKYSTWIGFIFF